MRDKTHREQVQRWAEYVKENPNEWKTELNQFIDAQFQMAQKFYEELAKTKEGREKIEKLKVMRINKR